jgi:hypothetical protein
VRNNLSPAKARLFLTNHRTTNLTTRFFSAYFVRAGFKPIEFDKGKTAIAVPSLDKLPAVIDKLITAVRWRARRAIGSGC